MSQTISTELAAKTAGEGGLAWSYVDVYDGATKTARLNVTGGKVIYDRQANVFRSLTCSLAGFEGIVPELGSLPPAGTFSDTNGVFGDGPFGDRIRSRLKGLVHPASTTLRAYMSVVIDDDTVETVPLGVFTVTAARFDRTAAGVTADIAAVDVLYALAKAGYEQVVAFPQGTNVETAFRGLVADCLPNAPVVTPTTEFPTARMAFLPVKGCNPRADAEKVAKLAGWVMSTSRTGQIVAGPPPSVSGGTSVWSITQAVIVSGRAEQDDIGAVNTLVVDGMTSEDVPVRAVASFAGGEWGRDRINRRSEYVTLQGPVTQTQAEFIAAAMLPSFTGLVDQVTLRVAPLFHIDPWDLVDVSEAGLGLNDTLYMVDRVVIDLTLSVPTEVTVSRRIA